MARYDGIRWRQDGMVLLISLVFLLALSLIGLASMQGAVFQQKIAGSLWHRNQSFQAAESGLRLGETTVRNTGAALPLCQTISACVPPQEAYSVLGAGMNPVSAVMWVSSKGGLYGIQSLGPVDRPTDKPAALYRVTSVGLIGPSRTVLETVYARIEGENGVKFRRVVWRQLQ